MQPIGKPRHGRGHRRGRNARRTAAWAAAAAAGLAAATAAQTRAATATWAGGAGATNTNWTTATNWSPDVVPTSTSDVVLGAAITPGMSINANGGVGIDIAANSMTISTANAFTLDGTGSFSFPGFPPVPTFSRLTLTSGALTRNDTAANQFLDIDVLLGGNAFWHVGGTGLLQVRPIG